jgi:hypothetical protein
MGLLLVAAKVPHATVDFDQLTACYPRPADDDRWGTKLGLTNLAALWKNYREAGARRLLIARVIESRSELDGFREAVPGADILVVRLRAAPETLQSRIRRRGPGRGMEWHLQRAVELAPLMDAQHVEDVLIETDGRDASTIAREILLQVGWLATDETVSALKGLSLALALRRRLGASAQPLRPHKPNLPRPQVTQIRRLDCGPEVTLLRSDKAAGAIGSARFMHGHDRTLRSVGHAQEANSGSELARVGLLHFLVPRSCGAG